jgi:hypothetical protein
MNEDELKSLIGKSRSRLCTFNGDSSRFWWTGTAQDRKIVAVFDPTQAIIHVMVFDSNGHQQKIYQRPNTLKPEPTPLLQFDGTFHPEEMNIFLRELFPSFVPEPVEVEPFEFVPLELQLTPLKAEHEMFMEKPDDFDKEEREELADWIRTGFSVLYCEGDDLNLSPEGTIL